GLRAEVVGGRLLIRNPGEVPKLVERVAHVTFSGDQARIRGQEVLYVTERAVFRLAADGVELIEVAEWIDPGHDVIQRMGFVPIVRELRRMPLADGARELPLSPLEASGRTAAVRP